MRIIITGANSMIGRAVIRTLITKYNYESDDIIPIYHDHFNLLVRDNAQKIMKQFGHGASVIHCAGFNGNITFNKKFPSDIFFRTTQIATNVLSACVKNGIKKVVTPISSCCYPCHLSDKPLIETNLWDGPPDPSVEAHGFAKRYILEYSRLLNKQYNLCSVGVIFNTAYGPYDSFDPDKTKVVGSLIAKIIGAHGSKEPFVTLYGTGKPCREFIYCDDAADGIIQTLHHYEDVTYPINYGCGRDHTITELAYTIKNIVGYKGEILFDPKFPDGQMKKLLDTTKMNKWFGPQNFRSLEEGLTRTIKWYKDTRQDV